MSDEIFYFEEETIEIFEKEVSFFLPRSMVIENMKSMTKRKLVEIDDSGEGKQQEKPPFSKKVKSSGDAPALDQPCLSEISLDLPGVSENKSVPTAAPSSQSSSGIESKQEPFELYDMFGIDENKENIPPPLSPSSSLSLFLDDDDIEVLENLEPEVIVEALNDSSWKTPSQNDANNQTPNLGKIIQAKTSI